MLTFILIFIIVSLIIVLVILAKGENKSANKIKELESRVQVAEKESSDIKRKASPYLIKVEELESIQFEILRFTEQKAAKELEVVARNGQIVGLNDQIKHLENKVELIDLGVFRREFTYKDPASYQEALKELWGKQDEMLKQKKAAVCSLSWEVRGSQKEGEQMVGNLIKLALRAFNGEADAAVARVKWNNFESMKDKILKSESAIEKMLAKWGITIADSYRNLKIKELKLTYEKAELDKQIQDEQRAIREEQKEEERALKEAEQARKKAEQEEAKIESALARAKAEMATVHTADMTKHIQKIKDLEDKLRAAEELKQRAISQAQLTKSGNVYIISNPGSFGENMFKIGMTRRLDPMDRIWELSDASVPFDFDVHGMIKTDDAPKLEAKFHKVFAAKRVNMINERKEFFNVTIAEIQEICSKEGLDVKLTLAAEAQEWWESRALRGEIISDKALHANA